MINSSSKVKSVKNLFDKFDVLDGIPLLLIPVVLVGMFAYVGFVVYINSVALGWLIGIPAFLAGVIYYASILKVTLTTKDKKGKRQNKSYGLLGPKWQAAVVWLNQIVICYWLVTASGFGAVGYIFVMLVVIPALYLSTHTLLSREVNNVEKD